MYENLRFQSLVVIYNFTLLTLCTQLLSNQIFLKDNYIIPIIAPYPHSKLISFYD